MNYPTLIIAVIFGIVLGMFLARRKSFGAAQDEPFDATQGRQTEKKEENKQKILEFLETNGKIQNDDVERLVGVSNATAERYLDELEHDGLLTQHGSAGHTVFYTKK